MSSDTNRPADGWDSIEPTLTIWKSTASAEAIAQAIKEFDQDCTTDTWDKVSHWVASRAAEIDQAGETAAHSTEDDYQHFLSYSGLDHSPILRYAYFHGADVGLEKPDVGAGEGVAAAQGVCERQTFECDGERWIPVSTKSLAILKDHATVKSALGRFSPALCKQMGFTDAEEQVIESLYSLSESFDFDTAPPATLSQPIEPQGAVVEARLSADYYTAGDLEQWLEHPADIVFVNGLKVGDRYEVTAIDQWKETYEVTKAPDETSDDYEVVRVLPAEAALPVALGAGEDSALLDFLDRPFVNTVGREPDVQTVEVIIDSGPQPREFSAPNIREAIRAAMKPATPAGKVGES